MLGAIIGDIVGSRFEFNNHRSTDFELFHKDCSFTDDTICTIAVADWFVNYQDFGPKFGYGRTFEQVLRNWCRKYPSSYGGMLGRWIHDDLRGPYNSFGNGAAMRVSPIGWLSNDSNVVYTLARRSAEITHNHPEGIKAARCIAESIRLLRTGVGKEGLKKLIGSYFYDLSVPCYMPRKTNTFDETCQVTVPQAIVCFLESTDFESAIRLAVSIGGDSDTIAAIAGSLAEAHYGIPEEIKRKALTYLPDDMLQVINSFNEKTKSK